MRDVDVGSIGEEVPLLEGIRTTRAIRRLLISGKRIPEVLSSVPATEVADSAIVELEQEIDSFLFEQRVSKEIAGHAAGIVIARRNQIDADSEETTRQGRPEETHLEEGGRFR